MDTLTLEASLKSLRLTLQDLTSAISLQASEAGHSQPASPAGRMSANSGPAPRRASHSRSPASSGAKTTSGIYGPTTFASSVPEGPLSAWESRLRQRLARIGSTECSLTWKASTTPAGRPLSRLVPSTRPIDETDCGSSHPEMALLVTASARDWKDTLGMATDRPDGRSRIDQLPRQVAAAALWPTPLTNDALGSAYCYGPKKPDGSRAEFLKLPGAALVASGVPHRGSSDTTEKPGALNPQFVCWLMGFPLGLDACAPTAMPSSRKSQRK